jgi:hypothetical protein
VLPEWRAARDRLQAFTKLPPQVQGEVSEVLEYMRLRQEAWEGFAQALREGDEQKARQALAKQELANAAAKRITDNGGKSQGGRGKPVP